MEKIDYLNYPNPIKIRKNTIILDGEWSFGMGNEYSLDSKLTPSDFIRVPFCLESILSGIAHTDIINFCLYERELPIKKTEIGKDRVILHFGAVDYKAVVFINDIYIGSHIGGYTPFEFDITDNLTEKNRVTVRVYDGVFSGAHGKQSIAESTGCYYTRTTGIWQSVWLEIVPEVRIEKFFITPRTTNNSVDVSLFTYGESDYHFQVYYDGVLVGSSYGDCKSQVKFSVSLEKSELWTLGNGRLYEVEITFGRDKVYTYFGLRDVCYDGIKFMLNGKSVFQRLVLDQGFYPDGIYTAPSSECMKKDIEISLSMGFNGARLHQKVFDPKYLYLCDKYGYMVWGEFPSWQIRFEELSSLGQTMAEWEEELERDYNHPAIVTWCPINEAWGKSNLIYMKMLCLFTKEFDKSRPCIDSSGGFHSSYTDVFDYHSYADFENFKRIIKGFEKGIYDEAELSLGSNNDEAEKFKPGQPLNVSEYGGIAICEKSGWGYGSGAKNGQEFVKRYNELTECIMNSKIISGFCYTQLYDVEQECNGLYRYDRTPKLSEEEIAEIRKCNTRIAEIEK